MHDQMPELKYVVAMGAFALSLEGFVLDSYNDLPGEDNIVLPAAHYVLLVILVMKHSSKL